MNRWFDWNHKPFEACPAFMRIKLVVSNKTEVTRVFRARMGGTAIDPMTLTGDARAYYQRSYDLFDEDDRRVAAEGRLRVVQHVSGVQLP